jgi:hypothetical protein
MKFVYRLKIELALCHGARCRAAELMRPSKIGMIVVFEIGSRFVEREKLVFWNAQLAQSEVYLHQPVALPEEPSGSFSNNEAQHEAYLVG